MSRGGEGHDAPTPSGAARRRALPALLLALLLAVTFSIGHRGIDFGFQYDEPILIQTAERTVETGLWLPRWYQYPSMYHHTLLVAAIPRAVDVWRDGTAEGDRRRPRMLRALRGPLYLREARTLFYAISLATVLWLFLLARTVTGDPWQALLAAALLASSFEVTSFTRILSADGLAMHWTTLAMLLTARALRAPPGEARRWLVAAAAVAGVATSCKYPVGIQVLVIAAAALVVARRDALDLGRRLRLALLLATVFAAGVIVITPGLVLDPQQAYYDILFQLMHYGRDGHFGNTIAPGRPMAAALGTWLGAVAFSPVPVAALGVTAAAVGGAVALWRDRTTRTTAAVLLLLPVLSYLFFSRQTVLAVRNLLFILPPLALCAAAGVAAASRALRRRQPRLAWLPAAAAVAVVALDLGILAVRMESVRPPYPLAPLARLEARVASHADQRFVLSDGVRRHPDLAGLDRLPNVVASATEATHVLALSTEFDVRTVRGGRLGRYRVWLGPDDISLDWVPAWLGPPRVVALEAAEARIARIPAPGLVPVPLP